MRIKLELSPNELKIVKDALVNNHNILKSVDGINHKQKAMIRKELEDLKRLIKKLDNLPEEGIVE